jgi:serine/threonine-protein kinase HipA
MPERSLLVYLDGRRVGRVTQTLQGNTTFSYDEEYRLQPDATPLSLSMPLTAVRHPSRSTMPFLQGLLPDNRLRLEQLASEHGTSTNAFALLSHIGRDAAGAVQLLPPGEDPDDLAKRTGDIERLSDDGFAARIGDIVDHANTWGSRRDEGRWSLAGAQPKIALFRFDDGSWGIPRDSTPTTHILKPAIAPYGNHDVNEFVTMAAARRLGLHVAEHEIVTTSRGHHVFVSRRYDRVHEEGQWRRRHQEDLCQALSVSPDRKYQRDGGPGVGQIAKLLRDDFRDTVQRQSAQARFFDALVFAVSAACTDAHAKNYSIILRGRDVELAPLYDLGTHAPYPSTQPLESAMTIGDQYRLDSIGMRELLAVARKLNLTEDAARDRIEAIRDRMAPAFAIAAADIDDPFAKTVADSIARMAESRGWGSKPLPPRELPRARVGTCGWSKPAWKGRFYPRGLPDREQLAFASRHLATLEINTTFHGLKIPADFLKWRAESPDDFVFSVKGHGAVTHDKRLHAPARGIAAFLNSGVPLLQEKLGPILWQVPDTLPFDPNVVAAFLATLPHSVDGARALMASEGIEADPRILQLPDAPLRHAFEVRHPSFGEPAFLDLLRRHDVASVATNTPTWPELRETTSDFAYVRFHGDAERFPNGYDDDTLGEWAALIGGWREGRGNPDGRAREVFAYFDNPDHGGAGSPFTARKLQRLLDGPDAIPPLPVQPPLF